MKLFIIVIFILILVLCLIYLFYKLFKNNRVKIKGSYIIPTDLNNMTDTSKVLTEYKEYQIPSSRASNRFSDIIYEIKTIKIPLTKDGIKIGNLNQIFNNDIKVSYVEKYRVYTYKNKQKNVIIKDTIAEYPKAKELKTSSKTFDAYFKYLFLLIYNFYNHINGYKIIGYIPQNINYVEPIPSVKQNGGDFQNKYNEEQMLKNTKDIIYDSFKVLSRHQERQNKQLLQKTFIPDFIIKMVKDNKTNYIIVEFDENNYFHQERTNFEYMSKCVAYNDILKQVKKEQNIKINILRITYPDGIIDNINNKINVSNYLISTIETIIEKMCIDKNGLNGAYILERFEFINGILSPVQNTFCCSIELKNDNVDFLPNNIDFNSIIYEDTIKKFVYNRDKLTEQINPIDQTDLNDYIITKIDKKDDASIEKIKEIILSNINKIDIIKDTINEIVEKIDEEQKNKITI